MYTHPGGYGNEQYPEPPRLRYKNCTIEKRYPHKHKDSREQFEMRTHKRVIDILYPTQTTIDSLMKLDLPAGVDVEMKL